MTTTKRSIQWKRNSCLDGLRVTWDAFIGDRRVAQVANQRRERGVVWNVWANGNGGSPRKLADAKAEVEQLFAV